MNSWALFSFLLILTSTALGSLEIPKDLSSADRQKATEILGLSSANKVLGNPYPLGGFYGVEIGYSKEVVPTSEISRLGSRTESKSETSYQVLTIGKGLFHNIDVFLQMTPQSQEEFIWGWGGSLRWGFYQSQRMPIHLSVMTYTNNMSFNNQILTSTDGWDAVLGFSVEDVTLYTGAGYVSSRGTFVGGTNGVTGSQDTIVERVSDSHYLAGVNLKLQQAFLAMQIDRYTQSIYSAKFGFRF